ncbi:MaoC/PaaZ C-terminal domain-containing protein [Hydrogenophaga laconesensis]|uniref:Acyl dehydratase n=1 Tax=Hydrogenophaga laconesensis TaxID=1805971 RepID=A0ABU1VJ51_9BURK|nr:MaoC/PaaZ C-terminal domain-containing protein [Hydrogenophaga laconesensis]MDR7097459.1 acyl dehydratase [Hydrogenophaga laconesensis]
MHVVDLVKRITYPEVEQTVSSRDAMLYGLALGFGENPCDEKQLRFVYERGLQVFPTMAITLCYPGSKGHSVARFGLDTRQVLHVFQGFEIVAPIPLDRVLVGQQVILSVIDKGPARGVLWTYENRVRVRETGELVCILRGASMSRVGGVSADVQQEVPPNRVFPSRHPDLVRDIRVLPQAGLLYRLSGDYNPLHADPDLARQGGFRQPILHGRCTFGLAGRAVVEAVCGSDGAMLRKMEARFSAPVYPGETLRTELWREAGAVQFRCTVPERGVTVLNHGHADLVDG